MHVHLVQPGDTLADIANRYRVTPGQLSLCNDLPPSTFLLPGQALCIPSELDVPGTDGYTTYFVQAGDTLRSLAQQVDCPVTWLAFCNQLHDQTLQPGDTLLLPHTKASVDEKPKLRLMQFAEAAEGDSRGQARLHTHARGKRHVRVDAAGQVHFPAYAGNADEDRAGGAGNAGGAGSFAVPDIAAHGLLICTLDGATNILPDVARAILRSDQAQHRILDCLAAGLRNHGGSGVIFSWHPLRAESEAAYLDFVREAGRRLRPMGLRVGLHLTADSTLLKHRHSLEAVADKIDHFFFDPVPHTQESKRDDVQKPPLPLFGVEATRQALQTVSDRIPLAKTWLLVHPTAIVCKREQVLHHLPIQQAMHIAYAQGSPLVRDADSGLLWFRYTGEQGACSVWLEDLMSFVRKLDLLHDLHLQGLALWETPFEFPSAWQYVHQHFALEKNPL